MDINNFIDNIITDNIRDVFNKYSDKLCLTTAEVADIYRTSTDNIRQKKKNGDFDGLFLEKRSEKEHTKWHKIKLLRHYFNEMSSKTPFL